MTGRKPPKPRREPLNRARIAQAALDYIDQNGVEALSTRRLGAILGVEAMALYRHYPSKEALLDAVAELLASEVPVPLPSAGGWKERVREFCRTWRGLARRHPRAFALLALRRFNTPRSLQLLDALYGELLAAGFDPAVAVQLFRSLGNYTQGTALDEVAGLLHAQAISAGADPHRAALEGLPNLAKVSPFLSVAYFDQVFEAGLDALLDVFSRRLPKAG